MRRLVAALFFLLPTVSNANYGYPAQQKIYISPNMLGACLARATLDETPRYFLDKNTMNFVYGRDIFFDYLAGFPQHARYASGAEDKLKSWVLAQPDNSIDPVKIYRESLKLNNGNIWNAILAVHDLLRNNARWMYKQYYLYESTPEAEKQFFDKFIDIRGDLKERGYGFNGDHEGTWYRIWGIMLHRLAKTDQASFNSGSSVNVVRIEGNKWSAPIVSWIGHNLQTSLTAHAAEWIKIMMPDEYWGEDLRKAEMNEIGGLTAASLIFSLNKDRSHFLKYAPTNQQCENRIYLR
jgi:hypothetical protein